MLFPFVKTYLVIARAKITDNTRCIRKGETSREMAGCQFYDDSCLKQETRPDEPRRPFKPRQILAYRAPPKDKEQPLSKTDNQLPSTCSQQRDQDSQITITLASSLATRDTAGSTTCT